MIPDLSAIRTGAASGGVTVSRFDSLDQVTLPDGPLHLAIGMFDGVHLGHRAVIEAAVHSARRSRGISAVLTFSPHPSALLRPGEPTRLIQDIATKSRVLARLGVDVVITQPFTREFAAVEAEDFVPGLQAHLPGLAALYVGENFFFGQGRRGDVPLLTRLARARGLGVFTAPRVGLDGEPISSTRVRVALTEGNLEHVSALLGYCYFSGGRVVPGKGLGRGLGFPTLNLDWSPELRPRLGVYVVRVTGVPSPAPRPAVANYGLRPTVEQATAPRLEAHLLVGCPFGAGDEITVEWLHFLRPENKFSGVDQLQMQITRDREAAAAYFRS